MKLYLDSNVFLARLLAEFGKRTDFMEGAFDDFLAVCAADGHSIVLSDLFFEEVKASGYTAKKDILEMIGEVADVTIEEAKTTEEDLGKAERIKEETGIHTPDNVHIQLALKTKCDYIITWNKKDFEKADKKIQCATPREFI